MRQIKGRNDGQEPPAHSTFRNLPEERELTSQRELLFTARQILHRRRMREKEFKSVLFAEPAWEMLLELFVQETSGAAITLTQLVAQSRIPASTVLRWVRFLERDGMVVVRQHPTDHGSDFIELSSTATQNLERYLAAAAGIKQRADR